MALSDELLASGDVLAKLRSRLRSLARECGASAAFLVDENGDPFASVGHVEFQLPHPLAGLFREGEADQLLGALVGEAPRRGDAGSRYAVETAGARALLVVIAERPLDDATRRLVRSEASEVARLLDPAARPPGGR